jgi:hypothetical protein
VIVKLREVTLAVFNQKSQNHKITKFRNRCARVAQLQDGRKGPPVYNQKITKSQNPEITQWLFYPQFRLV